MVDISQKDFFEYFKNLKADTIVEDDPKSYKYVLYARRSTKDKDKQEKSLPDQIDECLNFSRNEKLIVVEPYIQEKESAKDPDIRPRFRKMIEDVKAGKYQGILAWHPNRLARNMKEAGEIIDLLDKGIIKDLKFPSFSFENNESGKVMLGITFVLSKQYSDALSKDVKRCLHKRAEEGGWLTVPKHGYFKDDMHRLQPDGDNYVLIREAWKMRFEGALYREIEEYLNTHNFTKPVTNKINQRKPYSFDQKRLSEMFADPIYAGVMRYGDQVINLMDIFDFVPVVSPAHFFKINNITKKNRDTFLRRYDKRVKKNVKGRLLNGRVICDHCGETMYVSITSPSKGNKFYFRCDNKKCFVKNISGKKVHHHVRAKVLVDFVIDFLRNTNIATKEVYDHYVDESKRVQKDRLALLRVEQKSIITQKTGLNQQNTKIKKYLLEISDRELREDYESEVKENKKKIKEFELALIEIEKQIENNKSSILTFSKFTEQVEKLPDEIVKTKSLNRKNYLIEKIFSNLRVNNKKVAKYQLEEPFATFEKKGFFSECRGDRTRTCDLTLPKRAL